MEYHEYLKKLDHCPFCEKIGNRKILGNEFAYLTYALAPYYRYHLLVVPTRHIVSILELSDDENIAINKLIKDGIRLLGKLDHDDCNVLVRDSNDPMKSVSHLHYHLIPGPVGALKVSSPQRNILTEAEEYLIQAELKNLIIKT